MFVASPLATLAELGFEASRQMTEAGIDILQQLDRTILVVALEVDRQAVDSSAS